MVYLPLLLGKAERIYLCGQDTHKRNGVEYHDQELAGLIHYFGNF
ncbi:MAG: hypothetical protein Q8K75_10890 [Chlamydiales bacterium]|nr:hypothetical protein [Chlamydiales bacterium]